MEIYIPAGATVTYEWTARWYGQHPPGTVALKATAPDLEGRSATGMR